MISSARVAGNCSNDHGDMVPTQKTDENVRDISSVRNFLRNARFFGPCFFSSEVRGKVSKRWMTEVFIMPRLSVGRSYLPVAGIRYSFGQSPRFHTDPAKCKIAHGPRVNN